MYFAFTDEQKLLQESVERFAENEYPFETRRSISQSGDGFSAEHWKKFAELGWLGLGIDEQFGGLGGTPVETSIVMEGLGHALSVEPYTTTLSLCASIMGRAQTPLAKSLLPQIAEGKVRVALATAERQSRFNLANVRTTAEKSGESYRIVGDKCVIFDAPGADYLIVVARTSGDFLDRTGLSLFLVENAQTQSNTRTYSTIDGKRAADIHIDVEVPASNLIGDVDNGFALLEFGVDNAIVSLCAEAVGIMKYMHDATLEYLRTRTQFGQPLAQFQALQHRVVDMFVAYELSRSMAYMAALRLGDSAGQRRKAVSAAKVQIGNAGRLIGEDSIQLHGGMGMTEELPIGHYFKRLTMIDRTFGDVDFHLKAVADCA
ncbi:MAG: acyl-CoA dehydrogenase family protein [Gammaproteobacteria bacterium]|nr:acyl-CoA dehydrogenase family protein [Gammaproteobacteria bacterium]